MNPLGMGLISIMLCAAVLGVYETMFALSRWKSTLVETEKLRRENVQAQLDTLRSQVNPHFLFNSLNTLTSLVHDNPDLSVEFIQKLSRTYRYVLEIRDRELITLGEEMECVHAYLFLLNTRFGDNLKVNISIPGEAEKLYLAPLSLQLLIENAIKHNVVSNRKPLQIFIEVKDGDTLVVRNNLQKKEQEQAGTRSGLENIRNRYALLVKREIEVKESAEEFTVTLPLIKLEKYASGHH
jgi:LytS/YehU family sensor histidine kinase